MLRDGRKIIGTMRSFDQFANVVLEHAFERVIVGKKFADVPLGLYVIRGENVVLLGQLVSWQQQSHTILCTQRITGSMAIVPALSQWIDPDDAKERDTTENLLERVEVEDILELKQQHDEDNKLKAHCADALGCFRETKIASCLRKVASGRKQVTSSSSSRKYEFLHLH
eukprot:scaffold319029_cov40-Tisochrysis_lutea.AAC.1